MSVDDYSETPNDNTSISGINIAEGCPPGNVNNAIRQMMADVAGMAAEVAALEDQIAGLSTFNPVANAVFG